MRDICFYEFTFISSLRVDASQAAGRKPQLFIGNTLLCVAGLAVNFIIVRDFVV